VFAIPYLRITITSKFDEHEIRERLAGAIGAGREFKGKLTSDGFRLQRNARTWGRDPYRPVIRGRFRAVPQGTEVTTVFWPRILELFELTAFFAFAEWLAISKDAPMWWWPVVAFLFLHLGLYVFSFVPGQRWGESHIRPILESTE
jgi:hypothetical protein